MGLRDAFAGAIGSTWRPDPDAVESLNEAAESMRSDVPEPEGEQEFSVHVEADVRVTASTLREAQERADEIVDELANQQDTRDPVWTGITKW
jgi:hypothetical protein